MRVRTARLITATSAVVTVGWILAFLLPGGPFDPQAAQAAPEAPAREIDLEYGARLSSASLERLREHAGAADLVLMIRDGLGDPASPSLSYARTMRAIFGASLAVMHADASGSAAEQFADRMVGGDADATVLLDGTGLVRFAANLPLTPDAVRLLVERRLGPGPLREIEAIEPDAWLESLRAIRVTPLSGESGPDRLPMDGEGSLLLVTLTSHCDACTVRAGLDGLERLIPRRTSSRIVVLLGAHHRTAETEARLTPLDVPVFVTTDRIAPELSYPTRGGDLAPPVVFAFEDGRLTALGTLTPAGSVRVQRKW